MTDVDALREATRRHLDEWLDTCKVKGKLARSTIAMGIVVLDHLRAKCPVAESDVLSPRGEVRGARSGLARVLAAHGIPTTYLKEVTTRQAPQDAQKLFQRLEWGRPLEHLTQNDREQIIDELIELLAQIARLHLGQENIRLRIDRRESPSSWISRIMESASQRSGGVVEQHLVGAKLARRFPEISIPNHPAHAGDRQTSRSGDFTVARLVFHVTASPSLAVIDKCADNARAGLLPILVTPREMTGKARALASERGIENALSVLSIEDFLAMNVIEIATGEGKEFVEVLWEIIEIYNQRLAEVETILSLQIQLS